MLRRVRAWLAPEPTREVSPDIAVSPDPRLEEQLRDLGARVQKVARAQSKLSLRLDELGTQLDDNHREILDHLGQQRGGDLGEILDALDRLDDAVRSLGPDQTALAEGLATIAARLERHLVSRGVARHAGVGAAPDGRLVRVVGVEQRTDQPEGVVTRVVRSAATRGDELIREGEVLINRQPPI